MNFKKYIPKYKTIYKKYFNCDISDEIALEGTIKLFNLAKAIAGPMPKSRNEELLKVEKEINQ